MRDHNLFTVDSHLSFCRLTCRFQLGAGSLALASLRVQDLIESICNVCENTAIIHGFVVLNIECFVVCFHPQLMS